MLDRCVEIVHTHGVDLAYFWNGVLLAVGLALTLLVMASLSAVVREIARDFWEWW